MLYSFWLGMAKSVLSKFDLFLGALVGELGFGESDEMRAALAPATGATIGRLLGTLAKIPIAITVWLALSIAAFWM